VETLKLREVEEEERRDLRAKCRKVLSKKQRRMRGNKVEAFLGHNQHHKSSN
jgi:hypothetical protein